MVMSVKKVAIRLAGGDEPRAVAVCVRRGWSPAPVMLAALPVVRLRRPRSGRPERLGRADGHAVQLPAVGLEGREGIEAGCQPKNSDEYLTCGPREACVPTRDPADRAHSMRGGDGMLLASTARSPLGRPRKYPACCLTTAGVSHDSMFDRTHELQRELIGIPGIGADSCPSMAKATVRAMDALRAKLGTKTVRRFTRWDPTRTG